MGVSLSILAGGLPLQNDRYTNVLGIPPTLVLGAVLGDFQDLDTKLETVQSTVSSPTVVLCHFVSVCSLNVSNRLGSGIFT
jgi:hypothetical protein